APAARLTMRHARPPGHCRWRLGHFIRYISVIIMRKTAENFRSLPAAALRLTRISIFGCERTPMAQLPLLTFARSVVMQGIRLLRAASASGAASSTPRSEERRVGKEGRSRWAPDH